MTLLNPIDPPIPQTNPAVVVQQLRPEIDAAIANVLDSGRYILGSEVEAFEQEWAEWCCVEHAVGCANGTDGLELILRALDLPLGARVLAPSHTAVATISAIVRAGCNPYFADIDAASFTLHSASVERCLEAAVAEGNPIKALIAVHLYGYPCDLNAIQKLCNTYDIPFIEDCSQAHGACWKGRKVGGFGIAAAFSLYPTKNLGALGDAGVVTTRHEAIAKRIKQLRQYGWKQTAISDEPGINSRLDPLQAAILRVKLKYLQAHNKQRQDIAAVYFEHLADINDLTLPSIPKDQVEPVFHQFVVQLSANNRDLIRAQLSNLGVATLLHYPRAAHQMPAYFNKPWICSDPAGLVTTEAIIPRILSLPMGPHLTSYQAAQVTERLKYVLDKS